MVWRGPRLGFASETGRFVAIETPIMSSMVGSTPSDGAKGRCGNRTVMVRSSESCNVVIITIDIYIHVFIPSTRCLTNCVVSSW